MMSYILFDTVIVALIAGFALAGLSRGFAKTFFGLFGFLIAIVLALFLAAPLAAFLQEHVFEPALTSFFLKRLSEETMQSADKIDFSALPEGGLTLFSRFGVSAESLAEQLVTAGRTAGMELARSLAETAVSRAAQTLSHAVAFFSIFALSSILIAIVTRVLDLVAKVPGLKFMNRVFGLLTGAAEGLALAYVFARVLVLLEPSLRGSGITWLCDFSVEKTFLVRLLAGWDPMAIRNT